MICPECRNVIPELTLACSHCLRAKYIRDLQESEIGLLPSILSGATPMKLLQERRGIPHIGYRDGFTKEPYCGRTLRSPSSSLVLFDQRPQNLCPSCLSTFQDLKKRAQTKTARM